MVEYFYALGPSTKEFEKRNLDFEHDDPHWILGDFSGCGAATRVFYAQGEELYVEKMGCEKCPYEASALKMPCSPDGLEDAN